MTDAIHPFGTLYVVATPMGNLGDISARAAETLGKVDVILAEDTRVTKKLLNHLTANYQLPATKLISYHQHSGKTKKLKILKDLIDGKDLVLVTDAGTPGVSDPGNELIDYLLEREPLIRIVSIPGPSALTAALSICGFNVTRYVYVGFLPKKRLSKIFTQVKTCGYPLVFFDSPRRILKTLDRLIEEFGGDRRIFVGRELTKLHEETFRDSLSEVRDQMGKADPRGEIVVVLDVETK